MFIYKKPFSQFNHIWHQLEPSEEPIRHWQPPGGDLEGRILMTHDFTVEYSAVPKSDVYEHYVKEQTDQLHQGVDELLNGGEGTA